MTITVVPLAEVEVVTRDLVVVFGRVLVTIGFEVVCVGTTGFSVPVISVTVVLPSGFTVVVVCCSM